MIGKQEAFLGISTNWLAGSRRNASEVHGKKQRTKEAKSIMSKVKTLFSQHHPHLLKSHPLVALPG